MSGTRIAITTGSTAGNKRRAATHYGRRNIEGKFGSGHAISQGTERAEFTFSFDDLPVFDIDALALRLPENSIMKRAVLKVVTPFAGGTSLAVGTVQADDGTVIDADGLIAATVTANIDAVGDVVVGAGAQLDSNVLLQSQVAVVAVGTFTAGKAILTVDYEPQLLRDDDSNSNQN